MLRENRSELNQLRPDDVVSLTPAGRALWEDFLTACSQHAGRPLTGADVSAVLKKVAQETGQANPQFTDPAVRVCFMKHLRGPADQ